MPPKDAVRSQPAAPPILSLLSSAEVVVETERWEGGFSHEPEVCGAGVTGSFDPCVVHTKEVATGTGSIDVEPFGVFAGDSCSPYGLAARDFLGRARRKLASCESNLIESELWRGTLARAATPDWPNKYLAHLDSDVLTDSPTTPRRALACLEQALAECNCGSQGMIHAMPQIVTEWVAEGFLRRVTVDGREQLHTYLDTIVVPGSGYDGSGPPGVVDGPPTSAADGSIWAYATGMVHIRLAPVVVTPSSNEEALDRVTNLITYRAERLVAATFDCCHAAVELDIDLCGIGGAGS